MPSTSIDIRGDPAHYNRALKRSQASTKAAARRMSGSFSKVGNTIRSRIGGALIAVAGAAAIGALTRKVLQLGDEIAKGARNARVSTTSYQRLQAVFTETGIGADKVVKAIAASTKAVFEAGRGSTTYVEALRAIGLGYSDLAGLSPEEQFLRITEGLRNVTDESTKSAAAQLILGRTGREMGTLLDIGAEGARNIADEYERIGLILSAGAVRRIEEANDALARLGTATTVGFAEGLASALPKLDEATETAAGLRTIMEGVGTAVGAIVTGLGSVGNFLDRFGEGLAGGSTDVLDAQIAAQERVVKNLEDAQRKGALEFIRNAKGVLSLGGRFEGDAQLRERTAGTEGGDRLAFADAELIRLQGVLEDLKNGVGETADVIVEAAEAAMKAVAPIEMAAIATAALGLNSAQLTRNARLEAEALDDFNEALASGNLKAAAFFLDNDFFPQNTADALRDRLRDALDNGVLLSSAGPLGEIRQGGDAGLDRRAGGRGVNALEAVEEQSNEFAKSFATNFSQNIANALTSGGFDDIKEAAGAAFRASIAQGLTDQIQVLTQIAADALGKLLTNAFGGLGGGSGGGFLGGLFGGGKAFGGSVSAGRAYLVGERGPEMFVPGQQGQVVPKGGATYNFQFGGGMDSEVMASFARRLPAVNAMLDRQRKEADYR